MADGIEKILQSPEVALWDRIVSRLWPIRCAIVEKELGHIREQLHEKKMWMIPFPQVSELGEKVDKKGEMGRISWLSIPYCCGWRGIREGV